MSDWLNCHQVLYFWTVVREGGVSKAAAKLRLSQPTISAQVKCWRVRSESVCWNGRVARSHSPTSAVSSTGRTSAVRQRYYAISARRRLKHPAVTPTPPKMRF